MAESGSTAKSPLSPELLEQFRQTGIRLDREGRFWHEQREITHSGLRRALLRWLDVRDDDGRAILRLDDQRYAYVDVADAHLLVVSVRWEGDRAIGVFNDGQEHELDYSSLVVDEDDSVYCAARGGRLVARLTTAAFSALAEHIEKHDDEFVVRARGQSFPIGRRERNRK